MPPELLSGKHFSKAVDVYMFGVLLWELFTREIPFHGVEIAEIRHQVLAGERFRVPIIDCPRVCQQLMWQCWQAEPAKRPTFDAICRSLDHVETESNHIASEHCEEDALDCLIRGSHH